MKDYQEYSRDVVPKRRAATPESLFFGTEQDLDDYSVTLWICKIKGPKSRKLVCVIIVRYL